MPMEWRERSVGSEWATPAQARQILTAPQVGLAQQEEVVELALLAPGGVAFIFAQLMVAQAFEGFALAPRQLKNFLLLVAQVLPA